MQVNNYNGFTWDDFSMTLTVSILGQKMYDDSPRKGSTFENDKFVWAKCSTFGFQLKVILINGQIWYLKQAALYVIVSTWLNVNCHFCLQCTIIVNLIYNYGTKQTIRLRL